MKKSLKGALLSGLVFPGAGQMILKSYQRAIVLILLASSGLILFIIKASQQALAILDRVHAEGQLIDLNTISKTAVQVSDTSDSFLMNFSLLLVFICWIIGIVDAYIIGRKKDIEENKNN